MRTCMLLLVVAVAASADESCGSEDAEDGTCLLQLRGGAAAQCHLRPVELQKTAKFCRLDGELLSMKPLGDGGVQAVACETASCCAAFAASTTSCPDALASGDVSCEESTVSEEDLDFSWMLYQTSDLHELKVDLPEHQFAFADVDMPCSFVARESRARRVFPADTPEKLLMSMPPEDINPPTSPPTPSPTVAPTAHPCEDGSHGCDAENEMCVREGADFRCDCAPGFGRVTHFASSTCAANGCSTVASQQDCEAAAFAAGTSLLVQDWSSTDPGCLYCNSGCAWEYAGKYIWNTHSTGDPGGCADKSHNECVCSCSSTTDGTGGQCVRTPAPTPAPAAPVYEGCQIQNGGRSYSNYGQGKCVYLDGRDFGKLPRPVTQAKPAGFKFLSRRGSRCKSDCDADPSCCGYAVSRYQNCLMWYAAIRKKPGHDWGAANCMVKR